MGRKKVGVRSIEEVFGGQRDEFLERENNLGGDRNFAGGAVSETSIAYRGRRQIPGSLKAIGEEEFWMI